MPTPEGRVKAAIKKILDEAGIDCRYFMPVPYGYGESTVDFIGCLRGQAFAIEAKAPGEKPTPLQEDFLESWQEAGGVVFVIDGTGVEDLKALHTFVHIGLHPPPMVFEEGKIL